MTYREKFIDLEYQLPEMPEVDWIDDFYKQVNCEESRVYEEIDTNLYYSPEPKIIIKIPSTPYQKSKFNENFTFAFQSLVTGAKSTFIRYKDRESLLIREGDKKNGGIYPSMLPFTDNMAIWRNHINQVRIRLWHKKMELLQDYYAEVAEIRGEWWDLYQQYITSDQWKETRRKRLDFDGFVCQMCSVVSDLQVHHIHYKNVGNEQLDDLITVCKSCHEKIHGRKF